MNIFKKMYCRCFQGAFRVMLPILPYREPSILKSNEEVVDILKNNGVTSVLLVTDKGISNLGLTKPIIATLKKAGIVTSVYDDTVPNPTSDNVYAAVDMYKSNQCTAIIAFGGGSAMDCAKATGAIIACPKKNLAKMKGVLKVGKKLPLLIAVPTTAGTGSETTLAAVITDSNTRHKYAINDFPLIPRYAILDASLTLGLPKHITSTTGMDALTHAVEAYIGRSTTKDTRQNALDAVKLIFDNILTAYNEGSDMAARENMLVASYKAGLAFTKSYVGYVHAIAHRLGGKYNVPHGLSNAVLLPYVLKSYGKCIYKKLWQLGTYAGLFDKSMSYEDGAKLFIEKIESLNQTMSIPTYIEALQEEDIVDLASTAEHEGNPLYPVPKLYSREDLVNIYRAVIKK
ncbi:MAG: iron-containing alcohol dehydrogenase [Clostridia bacterium]|nr:iron-containing alcohol dehydrogenase [Clostridia bacterium]